jgi:prepilin-type N-terminal cleavage/methylation domain-containing protein
MKLHEDHAMTLSEDTRIARAQSASGFSLIELMVAMVVTLVITGAMYGLIAQGQGAFRREPALIDRQQQIRIAMDRMQEEVLNAGLGLGNFIQAFAENGNAVGVAGAAGAAITGVRPAADAALGGGLPDLLEIRSQNQDCPQVRATQNGGINGNVFNLPAGMAYPACYNPPSFVLALYPSGAAKWAIVAHDPAGDKFNFANNENTPASGSQFVTNNNFGCDAYLATPAATCPPWAIGGVPPDRFAKMDRIVYRLGLDTDGVPALYRSATGGYDNVAGTFNNLPPGPAWDLVARGIEDMQIRYRTLAGWNDAAPTIAPPSFDNVVREVEITLWARTIGEARLQGESLAAGNGVTAVRGSLLTSIAPRGAQTALMNELNVANRWQ